MNLVQNYLAQVNAWLPDSADEDVLQELESTIEEHLEAFQEEHGKPASDKDIADILRAIGSPKTVASRFGKQQYLIGPELYPMWRYSLRIALTLMLILFFINGLLRYVSGVSDIFLSTGWFMGLLQPGLVAVAVTTIIFAVLERQGKTDYFKDNWDPLKRVSVKQSKSDQQDAVTNVIGDVLCLIIWNRWLDFSQDAVYRLDSLTVQFHEIYHLLFWPVNILLLCSIALYGWQLLNQFWRKSTVIAALVIDCVSLLILVLMLLHVDQTQVIGLSDNLDVRITENIGLIFKVSFVVITGLILMDLRHHIKLLKSL
ncbi:HAAS signaling domain-containing protein [Planctobacterium marinum]|uniref:Uncharacterized protein n=1 Tax=Planctobacterium marinum TaxID=1631968 RepID=A0AA48KQU6_9ALTE|nr:hypothetical protein MACH26_23640 [Planctobacterium marinum]